MAAHPGHQYPQRPGEPDCRDYLRTGRCKYGESCKYNHPPNVQSGGGIKGPLDPNEPPFPIRPGEPPCPYYLKHGTCKFGQTCKFHHPPHVMATAATGGLGGGMMMNVINSSAQLGGQGPQQILTLNSADGGTVAELQTHFLQLLPQRPTEPDCIYFLRNGRCKYGATCKYHHPIDGRQQRHRQQEHAYVQLGTNQPRVGRHRSSSTGSSTEAGTGGYATVHLLPSHGVSHGSLGPRRSEPTHILVSDGPIRVMTLNQNSSSRASSSYQQASNSSSPITTSTSAASSYETAVSNLDFLTGPAQGQFHQEGQIRMDTSGHLWRRTQSQDQLRLSEDGSSQALRSSFQNMQSSQQGPLNSGMLGLGNVGSVDGDGALFNQSLHTTIESSRMSRHESRRPRSVSFGESPGYPQSRDPGLSLGQVSSTGWSSGAGVSSPIAPNSGRETLWEEENFGALGGPRESNEGSMGQSFLSSSAPEYYPDRHQAPIPPPPVSVHGRVPLSDQRRHETASDRTHDGNEDEGLSMMTSALLTMLDTPENSSKVDHSTEADDSFHQGKMTSAVSSHSSDYAASGPPTPRQSGSSLARSLSLNEGAPRIGSDYLSAGGAMHFSRDAAIGGNERMYSNHIAANMLSGITSHARHPAPELGRNPQSRTSHPQGDGWSPTWQGTNSHGGHLERNAQSASVLRTPPGPSQHSSSQHGGLFLS